MHEEHTVTYSSNHCLLKKMVSDKAVGAFLLSTSVIVFTYYSFWVLVTVISPLHHKHANKQPFVDEGHPVQSYFLPREYALLIPSVLLIVLLTGVVGFIAKVMITNSKAKKK